MVFQSLGEKKEKEDVKTRGLFPGKQFKYPVGEVLSISGGGESSFGSPSKI